MVDRNAAAFEPLRHLDLIYLSSPVRDRASQPFPTFLGTLDAMHLKVARTLRHVGLPAELPHIAPARAPPQVEIEFGEG